MARPGDRCLPGWADSPGEALVITAPDGTRSYYRHALFDEESYHNSFATFAPGGRWFVSAGWGTLHRLLVFAIPHEQGSSAAQPAALPLATSIRLSRPMPDVQGCVFTSSTSLLCTSSDARADVYPVADPLLAVRLDHPVGSGAASGTVSLVGAIPQDPTCPDVGEAEGLDLHGSTLTIAVNSSCRATTLLSTYTRSG